MNEIFEINKIDYYISQNVYSGIQTPLRNVTNYEIELYTTSGNTSVINDISYDQKPGNILVSIPGDLRYSIEKFECYCVHFQCNDPDIKQIFKKLPKVFSAENENEIKQIFKSILFPPTSKSISKTLYIQGKLMELISLLINETEKPYIGKYNLYISSVRTACEYIENNFEQNITLSDISSAVNLSSGFFHTVFKSIKKITPAEYLIGCRINHAKDMLRKSNLPLSEIAVLCGFGSQGYFNYVFKKKTALTPKKYRDINRIII